MEQEDKTKSGETAKSDAGSSADSGTIDQAFKEIFEVFAKFGDRESEGNITLKNIDKWLKQANILGKKITNADTAITFSKIAKTKKRMDFHEFQEFLDTLAKDKKMEAQELISQLQATAAPELSNATMPVTTGAVGENLRRMTDPSLYTGAHKERFDESGKGKGIAGREDLTDNSGYVTGYKEKDTYDKLHKKDEEKKKED
ncbi:tubulin polymerization-promoting protein homolog [Stegodyphus dumicola]|uniref:tubulin polymerization-promoting protein homolog n=1 Tax=Stegodyphus dumicola TaxID=202533 RepID=UPI0015B338B0|nr:tubulin polymerization-promoting protein homolog [Stegodyphus dumicola]